MTLGELPHLLFYGPAGTGMFILMIFDINQKIFFLGKTSTILALAKQMYTPAEMRGCVLEVNKKIYIVERFS